MKRIELDKGTTYYQAKLNAAALMLHNDKVNSVRVVIEKETNRMWIEFTEFPQKVIDKIKNL
jgi:hypothetical protein